MSSSNNKIGFGGILALLLMFLIGGVLSLILAWPIMLFIGNASIASSGVIPAIGYWATFWVTWALFIIRAPGN